MQRSNSVPFGCLGGLIPSHFCCCQGVPPQARPLAKPRRQTADNGKKGRNRAIEPTARDTDSRTQPGFSQLGWGPRGNALAGAWIKLFTMLSPRSPDPRTALEVSAPRHRTQSATQAFPRYFPLQSAGAGTGLVDQSPPDPGIRPAHPDRRSASRSGCLGRPVNRRRRGGGHRSTPADRQRRYRPGPVFCRR